MTSKVEGTGQIDNQQLLTLNRNNSFLQRRDCSSLSICLASSSSIVVFRSPAKRLTSFRGHQKQRDHHQPDKKHQFLIILPAKCHPRRSPERTRAVMNPPLHVLPLLVLRNASPRNVVRNVKSRVLWSSLARCVLKLVLPANWPLLPNLSVLVRVNTIFFVLFVVSLFIWKIMFLMFACQVNLTLNYHLSILFRVRYLREEMPL